jgi:hypothetical protein
MPGGPTDIPESMRAELSSWNDGAGIDLESWICHMGSFALAVGYTTVFWPKFVAFEGYILRLGFSEASLRGFETQKGSTPQSVQWVMNHLHIADIQSYGAPDASPDKLLQLGKTLAEIYRVKLAAEFPKIACEVRFDVPEDPDDIDGYQLSFWAM